MKPRLFVAGAAHIDRRGRVTGTYVPAASNPGTMREEIGGGAFNAARNAVRHGVSASILSLRGGDVAADAVASAIAAAGIEDISSVFLDRTTPSYTAILDADGELITGFADMGLYDLGFAKQVRRRKIRDALGNADAVLVDANMPAAALAGIAASAEDRPVYAIAISPAKVPRVTDILPRLSCLFMNAREARRLARLTADAAVADAVAGLRERGLRRGVVTQGGSSLTAFDPDGVWAFVPPKPRSIRDVTGAGDAIAGATVAHLMVGGPFGEAIGHGMAAAMLTVGAETVVASYTDAEFAAALALVGEPVSMA